MPSRLTVETEKPGEFSFYERFSQGKPLSLTPNDAANYLGVSEELVLRDADPSGICNPNNPPLLNDAALLCLAQKLTDPTQHQLGYVEPGNRSLHEGPLPGTFVYTFARTNPGDTKEFRTMILHTAINNPPQA